ncbi:cysteine-rich receptor-like protein kinase 25 [Rhododendron vialii]|uniref:cysteine-rich receptor-like protein kinase 25 n=1 Tax=Rhododendron vialii TaxID=182163 RepID=UPI0026604128|nr:cysteine-rich receptor-like protein kinase 25 [Rhododendron vialii]
MDDIDDQTSSDDSGRKFATAEANYSLLQSVYGLAQCTPNISNSDCNTCLWNCVSTFPTCCNTNQGARILFPSCYVRYETYLFYNTNFSAASRPPPSTTTRSNPGSGGVSLEKNHCHCSFNWGCYYAFHSRLLLPNY